MPFQDLGDRVSQIGFGAELDVIPGILGDIAEEFIQILGQSCRCESVVLGVVLLLEDEPM
jgi:hypothetical protein